MYAELPCDAMLRLNKPTKLNLLLLWSTTVYAGMPLLPNGDVQGIGVLKKLELNGLSKKSGLQK